MVLIDANQQRIFIICTILGTAVGVVEFLRRVLQKHRQEFEHEVKDIVQDEVREVIGRQRNITEHLRRLDREVVRLRDWLKKLLYDRGRGVDR